MFVMVLDDPLIVLLENVIELLNVTSGAAHSRPVAVPEFAVKTLPFDPTARANGVDEAEALINVPFAAKIDGEILSSAVI